MRGSGVRRTYLADPPLPSGISAHECFPDIRRAEMVLPVRIELTTSALPRMRSTTELRQHVGKDGRAYGLALATRQPVGYWQAMAKDDEKAKRLAEALRENLRKRKAQAREAQPNRDPTQAASE
jgi:hypothetical protein